MLVEANKHSLGKYQSVLQLTLEEARALHYLKDANKKTNKCIVLIALNAVFPYSLSGMWEAKGLRGKEEFIVKF